MLDDKTLLKLKNRLLQQQEELLVLKETGDDAARTVELDQSRVGRLSRMDALQVQAMSLETQRRRQLELQRITAALHRMEEDEYGFCVKCGEEIAIERLELSPAAPLCITCADQSEHNE